MGIHALILITVNSKLALGGVMILMDVSFGDGRSVIEATVCIPSNSSSFYSGLCENVKNGQDSDILGARVSPYSRELYTISEPT